ncbi:hypothetical protein CALVIDRAFT_599176 [Calocera viscosa TUFC12733]|uniref:Uncharacterized protein n=1 Tax=Calocera viscosa (strain TUFC12733) TaxID=1330018 RepID=A0A167L6N6_CALVF|nr:hypothetical protein CALVIDRAFT_599176 [Calocera viscosa TUFC12733]
MASRPKNLTYKDRVLEGVKELTEGRSHKAVHLNAIRAQVKRNAAITGLALGKLASPYIKRATAAFVEDGTLVTLKDQPLKFRLAFDRAGKRRYSNISIADLEQNKRRRSYSATSRNMPVLRSRGRRSDTVLSIEQQPLIERISQPEPPIAPIHEWSKQLHVNDHRPDNSSEERPSLTMEHSISQDAFQELDVSMEVSVEPMGTSIRQAEDAGSNENTVTDMSALDIQSRMSPSGRMHYWPIKDIDSNEQWGLGGDVDLTLFDDSVAFGTIPPIEYHQELQSNVAPQSAIRVPPVTADGPLNMAIPGVMMRSSDRDAHISSLQAELEHAHQQLHGRNEDIKKLLAELESAENRLALRDIDALDQLAAVALKVGRLDDITLKQRDRVTECCEEIATLEQSMEQTNNELSIWQRSVAELQPFVLRALAAESALQEQQSMTSEGSRVIEAKDMQIKQLQTQIEQLQASNVELEEKLEHARDTITTDQQHIALLEELERLSRETQHKLEIAEIELSAVKTESAAKDNALVTAEEAIQSRTFEVARLRGALEDVEKARRMIGIQADASQEAIADLKSRNESLEIESDSLRSALSTAWQDNATQARLINTLMEHLESIATEWNVLSQGLDGVQSARQAVMERLHRAQESLGGRDMSPFTSQADVSNLL